MKPKKRAWGIKLPDGKKKDLLLLIPSRDGYILTVPYSNTHVTILDQGDHISTHAKNQIMSKYDHLGELSKSEKYDDVIEGAIKLRKLDEAEYDTIVFYLTKRGIDILNERQLVWIEEKSKEQISQYLDLSSTISKAQDTARELAKSPESFFGLCCARELLSNNEIEVGISNIQEKLGIIKDEGVLYEFDLSSFLDLETESPLSGILEPLGIPILHKDIKKRFQDIITRARELIK